MDYSSFFMHFLANIILAEIENMACEIATYRLAFHGLCENARALTLVNKIHVLSV